jgi:protocatechuate 3,4-dioxygenase beta subunit
MDPIRKIFMIRRQFLIQSSLTAISIAAFGKVIEQRGIYTGDCSTTDDILGPKYRPGAPIRSDLIFDSLKGDRIRVKGKVFTDDCKSVLPEATVEMWHCNSEGEYDDTSSQFLHRAKWITHSTGEYSFRTIIQGRYLNRKLYRPAHFHFRVRATGHKELISQIYFKGDPHIEKDPWASKASARERVLEILPGTAREEASIIFNIFLEKV